MPSSFENVNYGLRPAKNIERKMLCEAFRRLSVFGEVASYRYIGFGSTYFTDFVLLHKALGITNMLSIEREVAKKERFNFNLPYSCIEIEFEESNEVLPSLSWDVRTIAWLDYDSKIGPSILTDVQYFCGSALPGSVLVITINAHPDGHDEDRVGLLERRVGREKVPIGITHTDLRKWGTADVYQRIIENEIAETLSERNGGLASGSRMLYKRLFNFHYADGPHMLTVGGLLYDEGQSHMVGMAAFENFEFTSVEGEAAYLIEAPNLTYREIRHLDSQLPAEDHTKLDKKAIPEEDVAKYARLYRYFPTFTEAEM